MKRLLLCVLIIVFVCLLPSALANGNYTYTTTLGDGTIVKVEFDYDPNSDPMGYLYWTAASNALEKTGIHSFTDDGNLVVAQSLSDLTSLTGVTVLSSNTQTPELGDSSANAVVLVSSIAVFVALFVFIEYKRRMLF